MFLCLVFEFRINKLIIILKNDNYEKFDYDLNDFYILFQLFTYF